MIPTTGSIPDETTAVDYIYVADGDGTGEKIPTSGSIPNEVPTVDYIYVTDGDDTGVSPEVAVYEVNTDQDVTTKKAVVRPATIIQIVMFTTAGVVSLVTITVTAYIYMLWRKRRMKGTKDEYKLVEEGYGKIDTVEDSEKDQESSEHLLDKESVEITDETVREFRDHEKSSSLPYMGSPSMTLDADSEKSVIVEIPESISDNASQYSVDTESDASPWHTISTEIYLGGVVPSDGSSTYSSASSEDSVVYEEHPEPSVTTPAPGATSGVQVLATSDSSINITIPPELAGTQVPVNITLQLPETFKHHDGCTCTWSASVTRP